jgi:hypothetical protein
MLSFHRSAIAPAIPFLLCSVALLALPFASHAAVPPRGQPVQMSGVVTEVVLDDFANHTSRVEYHLEDEQSHGHATLRFDGAPPEGLRTGTRLSVSGVAGGDGSILLSADSTSVQTPQSTTQTMQTATTQSTAAATVVSGVQNTIVIIANFTDATVTSTPSQIQDLMFTDPSGHSIDALFRETAFGNVGFSGQVVGPFVINFSTQRPAICRMGQCGCRSDCVRSESGSISAPLTSCRAPRWAYAERTAPDRSAAAEPGVGVQQRPGDVYAHELGHNLNMAHAATLTNQYGDARMT